MNSPGNLPFVFAIIVLSVAVVNTLPQRELLSIERSKNNTVEGLPLRCLSVIDFFNL